MGSRAQPGAGQRDEHMVKVQCVANHPVKKQARAQRLKKRAKTSRFGKRLLSGAIAQ